jgi:hypothetical protein
VEADDEYGYAQAEPHGDADRDDRAGDDVVAAVLGVVKRAGHGDRAEREVGRGHAQRDRRAERQHAEHRAQHEQFSEPRTGDGVAIVRIQQVGQHDRAEQEHALPREVDPEAILADVAVRGIVEHIVQIGHRT